MQLRRYDLVIQLSEEGAALGARGMRASSRDTLRDLECDMALATALAQVGTCGFAFDCNCVWTRRSRSAHPPSSHAGLAWQPLLQCGLADRALRESKPALACARLQEALKLLTDAPVKRALAVSPVGWLVQCMAVARAVLFAWSARVAVHARGGARPYQQPAHRTLNFTRLCCSVPPSRPLSRQ